MADPFGRALRDHWQGNRSEPLVERDGEQRRDHPIGQFYFGRIEGKPWLDARLDGPLVDLGAGAGKHALYFQESFETVAVEVSDHLVELLGERGVETARQGSMFHLREQFDRDRFGSALVYGTQAGLAGSVHGLGRFLGDLAYVTGPEATAVVDSYDPAAGTTADLLGYRPDPAPGIAARTVQFEYEGDLGETLLFRLFGPDRVREASVGTGWEVDEIRWRNDRHYLAALEKR